MVDIKACIFDLDGVVVDTAKYHYLAWKRLANELGFEFHDNDNERLKGISRLDSLNILLEIGKVTLSINRKEELAVLKNQWYLEYIAKMKPDEILPGVKEFIEELKDSGIKIGLGSASKNAVLILNQLGIVHLFETIVDGTKVTNAKPNPEIFLLAARELNVNPAQSVVFEDAEAGIEAAIRGGFRNVGVGNPKILSKADIVLPNFIGVTKDKFFSLIN
ncbi:MAG TPA: beta-phosphoglucomutase [Bacteroidales bacterium]|nr:beta-phosphoglucomutase [Bacteroidales bacterium]